MTMAASRRNKPAAHPPRTCSTCASSRFLCDIRHRCQTHGSIVIAPGTCEHWAVFTVTVTDEDGDRVEEPFGAMSRGRWQQQ